MPYDAVIFDLDGTLIDSERVAQSAGIDAFASIGIHVTMDFMLQLVGKDFPTCTRIIQDHHGPLDIDDLDRRWRSNTLSRKDDITLNPGAEDVLDALKCAGIPYAIATSSRREGAMAKIRATGLDALVTTVITRCDVTMPKPHPEPYLTAARALDMPAQSCLAVEDSATGVAAAMAANMTVMHVPDLIPGHASPAHFCAPDLATGLARSGLLQS